MTQALEDAMTAFRRLGAQHKMKCFIKIKRKKLYGNVIKAHGDGSYLVRYDVNGTKTTGWFAVGDVTIIDELPSNDYSFIKRNNALIICESCGYKTDTNEKDDYGYCPDCNSKSFREEKELGYW